jgi:large subunit ribosomal protein L6
MSRIGNKPVEIPSGVEVKIEKSGVTVKGPKGEMDISIPARFRVEQKDRMLLLARPSDSKKDKSLHGTYRSLIANMVKGVSSGFEKNLQIIGVGYRAKVEENDLVLQLGFSHPVIYHIPEGIKIAVGRENVITVSGYDKQLVGEVAAEIRDFYPPEPYKGKGIRYKDEWVRRKAGKTVASS